MKLYPLSNFQVYDSVFLSQVATFTIRLPWWLSSKESTCDAGDAGTEDLIPGWERSPGVGNGNPLQYFCVENPMDRGVWQATVHGVTKSRT